MPVKKSQLITQQHQLQRSFYLKLSCLLALLCVVIVWAFSVGKFPISSQQLMDLLLGLFQSSAVNEEQQTLVTVIWQLRLPRILAALLVGASLAVAGAAYQGMFRNPLVSPDILGVSAGAGLGAIGAIFFELSLFWVQLAAFSGGLLAVGVVYGLGLIVKRHNPVLVLVLAGVALSTLLGAGISLFKILADPYTQLPTITFWLLGGLNSVTLSDLAYSAPVMLLGLIPLVMLRWRMNLLSLSDDEALALGVNLQRMRLILIMAATLMTASAVSFTGIIGWVGLVIPHIARLLVGPHFSRLLPVSLVLGAMFLLITDTLARTVAGIELPLGILTALIGAPFFLYLLAWGSRR